MRPVLAAAAVVALATSFLAGCRDSARLEASSNGSFSSAAPDGASLLVQCGEGRQALVRTVQVAGRTLPHVECVAAVAPAATELLGYPQPFVQPAVYRTQAVEPAPTRVVYRERPVTRSAARTAPAPQREVRSWKKSALIIGGAAAGGAGVGAVIDGGKGAKKGAVIGGVAGTIYDLATRSPR